MKSNYAYCKQTKNKQKINIFANDRQVNVNSSYETQEKQLFITELFSHYTEKFRSKHTPKEPEVSIICTKP